MAPPKPRPAPVTRTCFRRILLFPRQLDCSTAHRGVPRDVAIAKELGRKIDSEIVQYLAGGGAAAADDAAAGMHEGSRQIQTFDSRNGILRQFRRRSAPQE